MSRKPDVKPGTPCGFPQCASTRMAVHWFNGRALCAYHTPFDVDWEGVFMEEEEIMEELEETVVPYSGLYVCGHCDRLSVWNISSRANAGTTWEDYECDEHARKWWPSLFPVV